MFFVEYSALLIVLIARVSIRFCSFFPATDFKSLFNDLLIFVGLDGYTPQKGVFCYQGGEQTHGRISAKNLTMARQECSANDNCELFTDWCGRGDEFVMRNQRCRNQISGR